MTFPKADPDYKHAAWALYRYAPSMAAAVIFCVIFLFLTAIHALQMFRTRAWYLIAFVIGGLFEFIGYAARTASARQKPGYWTLMPYIIQNMYILLAPAVLAASVYMILGRIILLTDGEAHSVIKRRWLTKGFVLGDVFSLMVQSGGGGLMAGARSNASMREIGKDLVIVGLFLQLISFGFFIVVTALFHRRMALCTTVQSQKAEIRWQSYLRTLYVVSALILIRSIFRVIEYIQGMDGYILTHEAFLYIFDTLLMFIVMLWMAWKHPDEIWLLLRGKAPVANGFKLISVTSKGSGF